MNAALLILSAISARLAYSHLMDFVVTRDHFQLFIFGSFAVLAVTFFIFIRANSLLKKRVLAMTASIALSLYLLELYATLFPFQFDAEATRLRSARSIDVRTKFQVVLDFSHQGKNCYPAMSAGFFMEKPLRADHRFVVPLSQISNALIVSCNELGYYSTFDSDEYGFNNPHEIWNHEKFQNVFVGDSFTAGSCVHQGESFVDLVRANYPMTLNLGVIGQEPITELGTMKEYLTRKKADVIFWMFFEGNDLDGLQRIAANPLLIKYLEPNFSQNLMADHRAIERLQIMRINGSIRQIQQHSFKTHIRLGHLRTALKSLHRPGPSQLPPDLKLFEAIMIRAEGEAKRAGARLVFVYLPSYIRYKDPRQMFDETRRDDVLRTINRLGLETIDLHLVFSKQQDPGLFFPPANGHYNEKGHALVASVLLSYLRAVR